MPVDARGESPAKPFERTSDLGLGVRALDRASLPGHAASIEHRSASRNPRVSDAWATQRCASLVRPGRCSKLVRSDIEIGIEVDAESRAMP